MNAGLGAGSRPIYLRTGGVVINGGLSWRTDQLAYGGMKVSGIGRERPRYSIRAMTEESMVLFND